MRVPYDREVLVAVLVHHQRSGISPCPCGGARLGESHPEHVADVYEQSIANAIAARARLETA